MNSQFKEKWKLKWIFYEKKFNQDYPKTWNIEKFLHKNYQKNSFSHSNIIFFTFTEVIFKVVQGYWRHFREIF